MKFLSQITLLVIMLSTSIAFFSRSSIRQSFSGILKKSLSMSASDTASAAIKANKVMVFSKTKCPFCKKAKEALTELKVDFGLIELG
jgi:thioredoxin-related protein